MTDLGVLGVSGVDDINNSGQIIGVRQDATTFEITAMLIDGGDVTEFPRFAAHTVFANGSPLGINSSGQVVGQAAGTVDGDTRTEVRAVMFSTSGTSDLGNFPGGKNSQGVPSSTAWDINDAGLIVGGSQNASSVTRPVIFHPNSGTVTDLCGSLTCLGSAVAVNNSGEILGSVRLNGEIAATAFLYNGSFNALPRLPGHVRTNAVAINDLGVAVGYSGEDILSSSPESVVVWENGVVSEVGKFNNYPTNRPRDINAQGQIIGFAQGTPNGTRDLAPFLVDDGQFFDVRTLIDPSDPLAGAIAVTEVQAINDTGVIIGKGAYTANGQSTALLLTPLPNVEVFGSVGGVDPFDPNDTHVTGGTVVIGDLVFGQIALRAPAALDASLIRVLANGSLTGTGRYDAPTVNEGGLVSPGFSPGDLTIGDDYTQNDGTLRIEVGDYGPGEFDRLLVEGAALLNGGVIEFLLADGFVPEDGREIVFLETTDGVTLDPAVGVVVSGGPDGYDYRVTAVNGSLSLTPAAVPEPASIVAALLATAGGLRLRRR